MITTILIQKILSLFLILFAGIVLVRAKVLKPEQSKTLSVILLYLCAPCSVLVSFEKDVTPDVVNGLLLAFASAILIHILLLIAAVPMKRILRLEGVELASIIYSNSGNLIIPLVTAIFGPEYVIYSIAFISTQLFFMWSHGKAQLCGDGSMDIKKILLNVNMLAVFAGVVIFVTGFRFVAPVQDAMESLTAMLGPVAMLVTGMIIGGKTVKEIMQYKRLFLVTLFRLIVVPVAVLVLMKLSGAANWVVNGSTILMISLMATMTPSASTITQMAVVYDKDPDYAGAINVMTTLSCIITMPLLIALYQLW